ncbi:MAG TPA: hypothetical protein VGC50_10860 [Gammaproteobacteria bacterium]|jgi:hypothetical protein
MNASIVAGAMLPIVLMLCGAGVAGAQEETGWSVLLEPVYMDAFGHDQHVLTMQEIDSGSTPATNTRTPASLDTEAGLALRFEVEWNSGRQWDLGIDGFLFSASRGRPSRTTAGPSGSIDQVVFDAWNRSYVSNGPDEELFFGVLGDTDIAVWSIDVYGIKTLQVSAGNRLRLALGARNADFDNDFHGQAGIQGVEGSLFDASSNYERMIGPLVGLAGDFDFGGNTVRGYIGQSVVFGRTQLTHTTSDFTGPVSETPSLTSQNRLSRDQDVAIPITELRINWLRPINDRLSLGAAANASVWWDVPVPPNVVPAVEGGGFNENTIVFFGIGAAVKFKF